MTRLITIIILLLACNQAIPLNLCEVSRDGVRPLQDWERPSAVTRFEEETGIFFDITGKCRARYGEMTYALINFGSVAEFDMLASATAKRMGFNRDRGQHGQAMRHFAGSCTPRLGYGLNEGGSDIHREFITSHEFGHMFGLEHDSRPDSWMCSKGACDQMSDSFSFTGKQVSKMQTNADLFGLCKP